MSDLKKLLGKSVSTDTRTLQKGDVFFALQGPNFDGHDYVAEAEQKGAACAVVTRAVNATIPIVQVNDTLQALSDLATMHRKQFNIPVIGVTGSCGKTTTKTMIASILSHVGNALATEGTLNNHIGLPLTVLKLTSEHEFAVFEMGANHVGEIKGLAHIAQPNVTLITNVAPVHIEGFGNIENIANAKAEIYQALPEEGVAVLNVDDDFSDTFRHVIGALQTITFGLKNKANVTASDIALDDTCHASFTLMTPSGETVIKLPISGEHHVMNALAASASALAVGINLDAIKAGLEAMPVIAKRTQHFVAACGAKLIDDSYNANLTSTTAALNILVKQPGKKVFAFADMLELGAVAEEHHREVGRRAKALGVDALYVVGPLARYAAEEFGDSAQAFDDQTALIDALKNTVDADTVILAKGSNSKKMWEVIEALK